MTIYVLGGGIAGLAVTLSLRLRVPSTKIIIFERCNRPSSDGTDVTTHSQGHGMMLLPAAITALGTLGAKDYVAQLCRVITRTCVIAGDNSSAPLDVPSDETMYCCNRTDLIYSLYRALEDLPLMKDSGNDWEICYDMKCVGVKLDDEQNVIQLLFSDETTVNVRPDDLVIGADGVGSVLYKAMNPNSIHRPLSRVFEVVTSTKIPSLARKLDSTFHKVILHEYGLAMGLISPSNDQVIGFLQFDTERYSVPKTASECQSLFHLCTSMIRTNGQSIFSQYCDVMNYESAHVWRPINSDIPNTTHLKNAIIIGDAAHPVLPFTSCGVTAALEDAIILPDYLLNHINGLETLETILSQFASTRKEQVQIYIHVGRLMLDHFVNVSQVEIELPYVTVTGNNRPNLRQTCLF